MHVKEKDFSVSLSLMIWIKLSTTMNNNTERSLVFTFANFSFSTLLVYFFA